MLSLILGILTFGIMFVVTQVVYGLTEYFCIKKGWMKSAQQRTDEPYLYDRRGRLVSKYPNPYYIDENGNRPNWRMEGTIPPKLMRPYF